MSKMAVCYNYPRLTPGSASNTQQFSDSIPITINCEAMEYSCLSLNRLNKRSRCTNRPIQSKHAPIQQKHSNKILSNSAHCTDGWIFEWIHTPEKAAESTVYLGRLTPTHHGAGGCRSNQPSGNYSPFVMGRGQ